MAWFTTQCRFAKPPGYVILPAASCQPRWTSLRSGIATWLGSRPSAVMQCCRPPARQWNTRFSCLFFVAFRVSLPSSQTSTGSAETTPPARCHLVQGAINSNIRIKFNRLNHYQDSIPQPLASSRILIRESALSGGGNSVRHPPLPGATARGRGT